PGSGGGRRAWRFLPHGGTRSASPSGPVRAGLSVAASLTLRCSPAAPRGAAVLARPPRRHYGLPMARVLSTAQVDARDRLAYWTDAVCDAYVQLDCSVPSDEAVSGEIRINTLATLELSKVTATP